MHELRFRYFTLSAACLACGSLLLSTAHEASADIPDFVPAFSGAEGYGARSVGGRGGQVIRVTNLNDSGPGSYRAALEASGPRTVVFDVAGTIHLDSAVTITNPYITIAGQTAPGGGITIAGASTILGQSGHIHTTPHDIVIRHMRFRRGLPDQCGNSPGVIGDCGRGGGHGLNSNSLLGRTIVDHVSASWASAENISIYRNMLSGYNMPTNEITIQWSILSEALTTDEGATSRSFGSTMGGKGASLHHNLWASNRGRNMSLSHSNLVDIRNNVFFNWAHRTTDGGSGNGRVNMINNYYKPGPATNSGQLQYRIANPQYGGFWYVDGNHVEGNPTVTEDNWAGGVQGTNHTRSFVEFTEDLRPIHPNDWFGYAVQALEKPISTQSAVDAYELVLAGAGASLFRDEVDLRVIDTVITGNPTAGPNNNGIIHSIDSVGGWPDIPFEQRPADWDTDGDGIPDYWKLEHGLTPGNASDGNADFAGDGFTNLEHYLNEIGAFKAPEDVVWEGGHNNRYAQIHNWHIWFQPSRFDTAQINHGTVVVDVKGQHAGTLLLGNNPGDNPELQITAGWLQAHEAVVIGADDGASAALSLSGGKLSTPLLAKGAGGTFNFTGGELNAEIVGFDLVNDGGRIAPGNTIHTLDPTGGSSIGSTLVLGDLTINSGELEIEIGSPSVFDQLFVAGHAALDGTLNAVLEDGYEPEADDEFEILMADSLAGTFANAASTLSVAGGVFDVTYTATSVLLSNFQATVPGLPGDFNGDGVIDAADYAVWRDGLGTTYAMDDYQDWKNNFGATIGEGSGTHTTAVPEPASVLLLLLALVASGTLARRR